jgi:hypothetical protein
MKKALTFATLAFLLASCQQTPTPTPDGAVLGLLEVKISSIAGKISSSTRYLPMSNSLSAQSPSLVVSNLPVLTSTPAATTSDTSKSRRYITATYTISNPVGGTNFSNLTFHAVKINNPALGALSVGNSALRNLKDQSGAVVSSTDVAESIVPGNKVGIGVGDVLNLDVNGADFAFIPSADVATVQSAADASALGTGSVTALDYGFTARQSASSPARAIAAGGTGIVTLGFSYPISNPVATSDVKEFSVTYLVTNEGETRVTRSLEESGDAVVDVCSRATAISATKLFLLTGDPAGASCAGTTVQSVFDNAFIKTHADIGTTGGPIAWNTSGNYDGTWFTDGYFYKFKYGGVTDTDPLSGANPTPAMTRASSADPVQYTYTLPSDNTFGGSAFHFQKNTPSSMAAYTRLRIRLARTATGSPDALRIQIHPNTDLGDCNPVADITPTATLTEYTLELRPNTFQAQGGCSGGTTLTQAQMNAALTDFKAVRVLDWDYRNLSTTSTNTIKIGAITFLK